LDQRVLLSVFAVSAISLIGIAAIFMEQTKDKSMSEADAGTAIRTWYSRRLLGNADYPNVLARVKSMRS
jgi:hypothetical protein